jgi:hypothetical protein
MRRRGSWGAAWSGGMRNESMRRAVRMDALRVGSIRLAGGGAPGGGLAVRLAAGGASRSATSAPRSVAWAGRATRRFSVASSRDGPERAHARVQKSARGAPTWCFWPGAHAPLRGDHVVSGSGRDTSEADSTWLRGAPRAPTGACSSSRVPLRSKRWPPRTLSRPLLCGLRCMPAATRRFPRLSCRFSLQFARVSFAGRV